VATPAACPKGMSLITLTIPTYNGYGVTYDNITVCGRR
jgi:hypothetical protein